MAAAVKRPASPVRKDPAKRPLGGPARGNRLVNPDPRFKYTFVAKGREPDYIEDGYELSRYVEGGCRPATWDGKAGEVMDWMGMSLMQIDLEEYEALQAEGQASFDVIERQILDPRATDGRPIYGIEFFNETKAPQEELV